MGLGHGKPYCALFSLYSEMGALSDAVGNDSLERDFEAERGRGHFRSDILEGEEGWDFPPSE